MQNQTTSLKEKKTNTNGIPNHSNIELEFYPSLKQSLYLNIIRKNKIITNNLPYKDYHKACSSHAYEKYDYS
ncbi:MAG: hypothetical protein Ct9H300mP20_21840 [Gammaproteobacteria bacterium]|nr:MAG: hypothetical protein Ct9H300mP20_21840 [Gammaproteobacteria bacterium]